MIVVFDLDDTLYDEKTFVYSGLTEVSKWISLKSNFEQSEIFDYMVNDLLESGRGKIFNNALEKYFKFTQKSHSQGVFDRRSLGFVVLTTLQDAKI